MTVQNFIISNKWVHRLARHVVFWIAYSFYFWLQSITALDTKDVYLTETYKNALVSLYCFLPSCIFSVYIFIYILLPAFLVKKKYYLFGLTYISMYVILTLVNNLSAKLFISSVTYNYATKDNFLDPWGLSATNTMWAFSIGIIAMGIKLAKKRYMQSQENLLLIQRKSATELSYQKALLHPEFLTGKLDDIYAEVNVKSAYAPEMVLRLSDLLSYMLYEGDTKQAPLKKELSAVKDFIFLEQAKQDKSINIQLRLHGDAFQKFVDPLLILNLIQASVGSLTTNKNGYYDLEIDINVEPQTVVLELLLPNSDRRNHLLSFLSRLLEEKHNQVSLLPYSSGLKMEPTLKSQKYGVKIYLPLLSSKGIEHGNLGVQSKPLSYEFE